MYVETGEETLVHFVKEGSPLIVSVDDESYARLINDGYAVVAEIMRHTRLPQDPETGCYAPELRR